MKVRCTVEERDELLRRAGGQPLGPFLVRSALWFQPIGLGAVSRTVPVVSWQDQAEDAVARLAREKSPMTKQAVAALPALKAALR